MPVYLYFLSLTLTTRQVAKTALAVLFVVVVIVANSSPLPNVNHVMCLGLGLGVVGGVGSLIAASTEFLSESCACVDVNRRNVLVHAFCCGTERSYMWRGVISV